MPDGDFRRPPRLWEEQLQATVDVQSVGISSLAASTVPTVTMPDPGGVAADPAPPAYADITTTTPAAPTVEGVIAGLNVTWSGMDTSSKAYPAGMYCEVHVSESTGFTPDATTLKVTLSRPGTTTVTGLTAGTTYYVKVMVVDEQGQKSPASAQVTTAAGFIRTNDYGTATIGAGSVSFDARAIGGITTTVGSTTPTSPKTGDVWLDSTGGSITHKRYNGTSWDTQAWGSSSLSAGCITATQMAAGAITAGAIAAGAITAEKIAAGTITADKLSATYLTSTDVGTGGSTTISGSRITTGTINADLITAGTLSGRTVQTSTGGNRIQLANTDALEFYVAGTKRLDITPAQIGSVYVASFSGGIDIGSGGISVAGANVDMAGVYGNNTTGIDTLGITTGYRVRRISSSQAIKYDIATLSGTLSDSVDPGRLSDVATVDPTAILDVAVTEFSVIDDGEATDRRVLGFIADDVADKLPIAVTRYDDGTPAGVLDTSLLAALLAVVQQQQQTIADLTARIEALEG